MDPFKHTASTFIHSSHLPIYYPGNNRVVFKTVGLLLFDLNIVEPMTLKSFRTNVKLSGSKCNL